MIIKTIQVVESEINYPMASLTKPPNGDLIVDRAFVYLKHVRATLLTHYVSILQVLGFYAEFKGIPYHNGVVPDAPDTTMIKNFTHLIDLERWLPEACRELSLSFVKSIKRYNIADLDKDGKPITDLKDAELEQAYTVIHSAYTVQMQTLTPDQNPDKVKIIRNPNMPIIEGYGINIKKMSSMNKRSASGGPQTAPAATLPPM